MMETQLHEMTLRDFFAATAMQGIVANRSAMSEDVIASRAYRIANAMLKERERKQDE